MRAEWKAYTFEDREFIRNNWLEYTDLELSVKLGRSEQSVSKQRLRQGHYRQTFNEIDPKTIALIMEMKSNGKSSTRIGTLLKLKPHNVRRLISKTLSFVERSYNTITLVMDSKINYD